MESPDLMSEAIRTKESDFGSQDSIWKQSLDCLPDGISIHQLNGTIIFANERLAEIYGRPVGRIVGLTPGEVFQTGEGDCPEGNTPEIGVAGVSEGRCKVGERVFNISIFPIIAGEQGAPGCYVRLMRDVSGQELARAQLLKAEQFATLGQMISGIAHDVGTPLNIISGYCEYLMMKTGAGNAGHKELATILQQTRRIAEFIRQMLDLARPPQARADAIELKGFLEESLDLISHHLRKADVKVRLKCDATPPLIYGDAARFRQALFNVILNACQKLGSKSEDEIHLGRLPDESGPITISLIGIEEGGVKHDFSRSFPGLLSTGSEPEPVGIGLSLAREILTEFGATVQAKPLEDSGVSLVISLERARLNLPAGKR
jgi:nitrogen-specific signal transduction histidine kinase